MSSTPSAHLQTLRLEANEDSIAYAAAQLRAGEIVALPTETVYGLAGNARDAAAVARIFAAKGRPSFDPLIVHLASESGETFTSPSRQLEAQGWIDAAALSEEAQAIVDRLVRAFWPGPLTLVLPRAPAVLEAVTGALPTVALRMPSHPIMQRVLQQSGCALAAPSANRFAQISPTRAEHVMAELQGRIPLVLDAGPCAIGLESTIVQVDAEGGLALLRPGKIGASLLASFGRLRRASEGAVHESTRPLAPGMLSRHYAPQTLTRLFETPLSLAQSLRELGASLQSARAGEGIGLLLLQAPDAELRALLNTWPAHYCRWLSEGGDAEEAAHRLYASLRELDGLALSALWVQCPTQEEGLWGAIRDRLRRAAAAPAD